MISRAKIDGNERQPNDARCVHRKSDEFGFVERFGDFPRQDGVDGANDHQQYRI